MAKTQKVRPFKHSSTENLMYMQTHTIMNASELLQPLNGGLWEWLFQPLTIKMFIFSYFILAEQKY